MVMDFLAVTSQVRFAHTDIQVPDFSDYRRADVKDPRTKSTESAASRQAFTYMVVGGKLALLSCATSLSKAKTTGHSYKVVC